MSSNNGTVTQFDEGVWLTRANGITWPILICLLGEFRVLKGGRPVALHSLHAEAFLRYLALRRGRSVSREVILETLWPDSTPALAGQSLNSLVHSLRKSLGGEMGGETPILHGDGYYQLNAEAGVGVDVAYFEHLVNAGDQYRVANDLLAATTAYIQAVQLYRGDLSVGVDVNMVVEREMVRARFLSVLGRLADYYFSVKDYALCLHYAQRLLEYDVCREDAHRLVMQCYVRQGERAQALRQYRLCESILRAEFDVEPEPRTTLLYDQMRQHPESV